MSQPQAHRNTSLFIKHRLEIKLKDCRQTNQWNILSFIQKVDKSGWSAEPIGFVKTFFSIAGSQNGVTL